MFKTSKILTIWLIIIVISFIFPDLCPAKYDYINISNPFLRKIPIAVPLFKAVSASSVEIQISKEASRLLSDTLDFTGYFKILDRSGFLFDSEKIDIAESKIIFGNWTTAGAELLITGKVSIKNELVEIELRLYDTIKKRLLAGKRYKGWMNDQRRIIHRFCGEVIYLLTGHRGIFSSKIAFVSTGSGNKEIYLCDFDGYNPEQFTNNNTIALFPAWSRDAEWIAYTSYRKGKPDLYIKHLYEKRGTIIDFNGANLTPAWVPNKSPGKSPDKSNDKSNNQAELSASLSFSGDSDIYLLTKTGKIIKQLTDKWGIDISPSWSPDGGRMAFVSKRAGTPQIYIKNIISGQIERLTFYGRYNTQPCWSPTGDKIAYSAMENGQINIFVIGVDGKGLIQLTYNEGDNESPTWSPDGSLIVFSSTREGLAKIYVMNSNGSEQRRLLNIPGEQTDPEWSPRIINKGY